MALPWMFVLMFAGLVAYFERPVLTGRTIGISRIANFQKIATYFGRSKGELGYCRRVGPRVEGTFGGPPRSCSVLYRGPSRTPRIQAFKTLQEPLLSIKDRCIVSLDVGCRYIGLAIYLPPLRPSRSKVRIHVKFIGPADLEGTCLEDSGVDRRKRANRTTDRLRQEKMTGCSPVPEDEITKQTLKKNFKLTQTQDATQYILPVLDSINTEYSNGVICILSRKFQRDFVSFLSGILPEPFGISFRSLEMRARTSTRAVDMTNSYSHYEPPIVVIGQPSDESSRRENYLGGIGRFAGHQPSGQEASDSISDLDLTAPLRSKLCIQLSNPCPVSPDSSCLNTMVRQFASELFQMLNPFGKGESRVASSNKVRHRKADIFLFTEKNSTAMARCSSDLVRWLNDGKAFFAKRSTTQKRLDGLSAGVIMCGFIKSYGANAEFVNQ